MSKIGEIGNNNDATSKALRKFEKEFEKQMKIASLDRECTLYCVFGKMAALAQEIINEDERDKAIDKIIAFIVENKLSSVHKAHESFDEYCSGWEMFHEFDPLVLYRLARYLASDLDCYYPKNCNKKVLKHTWRYISNDLATDAQRKWFFEQAIEATGVTLIDDFLPLESGYDPTNWISKVHVIELMLKSGLIAGTKMLSAIIATSKSNFGNAHNAIQIANLINNIVEDNEPPAKKVKRTK